MKRDHSFCGRKQEGGGVGRSLRASKWDVRMALHESMAPSPVHKTLWRAQGTVNAPWGMPSGSTALDVSALG